MSAAYSKYETFIGIFRKLSDLSPGEKIFSGSCSPESLTISESWETLECFHHGSPKRGRHVGEISYEIDISSVFTSSLESGNINRIPELRPGEIYYFVVVLYSEERKGWIKETYSGVQLSSQSRSIQGEQWDQDAPLVAESRYVDSSWGTAKPGLDPVVSGEVVYYDGSTGSSMMLYRYHFFEESFISTGVSDAIAAIDSGAAGDVSAFSWYLQIAGEVVMAFASADNSLNVTSVTDTGIFPDISDKKRVDFTFGGERFASVDEDGNLSINGIKEGAQPNPSGFNFSILDGSDDWLATIDSDRLTLTELIES